MFEKSYVRHIHKQRTSKPFDLGFWVFMPQGQDHIWYTNFWVERLGWDGLWALLCSPMNDLTRAEFAAVGSSEQLKEYFRRLGCGDRMMWHPLKYEWDSGMNQILSNHLSCRLRSNHHPLYRSSDDYSRGEVFFKWHIHQGVNRWFYYEGLKKGYRLKEKIDEITQNLGGDTTL